MAIRVIDPPNPFVLPSELGAPAASSSFAELVIAAVTGEFDGPTGKLGRCFGPQTIEYTAEVPGCGQISIPCPPLIRIVAVERFDDVSGPEPITEYRIIGDDLHTEFRSGAIRVRYEAGYDEVNTGPMPAGIRQAIIMKSRLLLTALDQHGLLKAEDVEGVGRLEYSLPEQVSLLINRAVDALVAGLKVYRT